MLNFEYYTPTKVVFGKGTEKRAGELARSFGASKVLVHYGGGSAKKIRSSGPGLRFSDRSRTALRIAGRRGTQPPPWTG